MTEVDTPQAAYTHTSQEAFTVPVFRFVGQQNTFTFFNNLNKAEVSFPSQVLDTVIEQLNNYKEYLAEMETEEAVEEPAPEPAPENDKEE